MLRIFQYILMGILLYGIVILYGIRKLIQVFSKYPAKEKFLTGALVALVLFIAYRFGGSLDYYILAILLGIFIVLLMISKGLGHTRIVYTSMFFGLSGVRLIAYEDVEEIVLEEAEDFRLLIKTGQGSLEMSFPREEEGQIREILRENRIKIKEPLN